MTSATLLGPVSTLERAPLVGEVFLDFSRSIPQGLNFTRGTPGYFVDANGYPRIAAPGVPMFEAGGLLVDGANTNYLPNSEYDPASGGSQRWWAPSSRAFVSDAFAFGDITLARVQENAGSFTPYMGGTYSIPTPVPLTAGQPICFSAFHRRVAGAPANRYMWCLLRVAFDDGSQPEWRVGFRADGSVGQSSFSDDEATREAVSQDLVDGVKRIGLIITPQKNGILESVRFVWNSDLSVNMRDLDGTGSMDIGGLQISHGLMTSYIRTTSAPATREADHVLGPLPGLLRPGRLGGTILADTDIDGYHSQWSQPVYIGPSTTGSSDGIFMNVSSTTNSVKWQVGSPLNYNQGISSMPFFPGPEKSGIRLQPGSVRCYAHGESGNNSTSTSLTPVPTYVKVQAQGYRRFRVRSVMITHEYIPHNDMLVLTKI